METIPDWCLYESTVSEVVIPGTVTRIGKCAFADCKNIEEITLPSGITELGVDSFSGCTSLKEITLPSGTTELGAGSFSGCTSLKEIDIPKGVKEIQESMFSGCAMLNRVGIEENDSITYIASQAFAYCASLETITLPPNLKELGTEVFQGTGIQSITIPKTVTECSWNGAFHGANSLKKVIFEDGMETIPDWCLYKSTVSEVVIPGTVTRIGDYAFDECENFTIYGYEGSYAQVYANENDIPFEIYSEDAAPGGGPLTMSKDTVETTTESSCFVMASYRMDPTSSFDPEKDLKWTSGDESILKFVKYQCIESTENPNEITLLAEFQPQKKGTVQVTVSDGSNRASCTVNVTEPDHSQPISKKTITGTLQGVDYLGGSVRIDGTSYPSGDGFDMTKALEIYNEHENKIVAACLVNDKMTSIDDITEVMELRFELSSDTKSLTYQNGSIDKKEIAVDAVVRNVAKAPYDTSVLQNLPNQDLLKKSYDGPIQLTANKDGFYLEEGDGWFSSNKQSVKYQIKGSLSAGATIGMPVSIYVEDNYKPESVTEVLNVEGVAELNGTTQNQKLQVSIGNLDLQREEQEEIKSQREPSKTVSKAQQELEGLTTGIETKLLTDLDLSNTQIDRFKKCVNAWIANLITVPQMVGADGGGVLEKTGFSSEQIMDTVLAKMGINKNTLMQSNKVTATTTVIAWDRQGKKVPIHCSVDLNCNTFEGSPIWGAHGTMTYYVKKNGKRQNCFGPSTIVYANMDAFADQLKKVAEDSIKLVYDKAWGDNANKAVEMLVGKPISSILNQSVGTFSNNVFELLKAPTEQTIAKNRKASLMSDELSKEDNAVYYTKRVSLSGAGDVTLLDAEGNPCGVITENTVDPQYDSIHMYTEGDQKWIFLTEDNYTLQMTGTDTGKLQYTVEEFMNGERVRTITFQDIPVKKGQRYYSTIPDTIYLDNAVYEPVSDSRETISAETDNWQDSQNPYIAVSGITLNKSELSLNVGGEARLTATISPKNATNSDIDWTSSKTSVATVSDTGAVKAVGVGTTQIEAKTVDGGFATTCTVTVNTPKQITKASQTITAKSFTKTYGNKSFSLGAKAKTKLSYKSSNTKVATVSSTGKVTLKGPGKATITITAAATSNYNAATKKITITVKPKKATLKKAKSTKKRTLKVMWKRDTKATGYQIVIAQNKKFKKGKKTALIKKNKTTSRTFKKLKSRKNYYYKVRAYKQVGKTKIYGAYSKIKRIKVN